MPVLHAVSSLKVEKLNDFHDHSINPLATVAQDIHQFMAVWLVFLPARICRSSHGVFPWSRHDPENGAKTHSVEKGRSRSILGSAWAGGDLAVYPSEIVAGHLTPAVVRAT